MCSSVQSAEAPTTKADCPTQSFCVLALLLRETAARSHVEHLPEVLAEMKQRCGHVKSIAPRVRQRPGAVRGTYRSANEAMASFVFVHIVVRAKHWHLYIYRCTDRCQQSKCAAQNTI
eukprot:15144-Heterococcus_DN1.PRE.2